MNNRRKERMNHPKRRQGAGGISLLLLAAATALVALLGLAPAASALPRDPVASGTTDLHFKRGMVRKLNNLGVSVQGLGAATVTGNKVSLPVREGKLDPTDGQGFLRLRGGFKLSRGNRGVPMTEVMVHTVRGAVYAKVARAKMQIGTLTPLTVGREGFGANFKAVKLTLNEKSARRISNRLGLRDGRRINPGRVLSNVYSTVQPSTVVVLPQGTATLTADKATLGKFAAKGVKVPQGIAPIAPASSKTPGAFEFPIAGGTLSPLADQGTVRTGGGIQIEKKAEPFSPQMKLLEIQVDFAAKTATVQLEIGPTPPFPGTVGRSSIADVVLPKGSVSADPAKRTITVKGAEARLQAVAAATLNDVFNQPAPTPPPASNFVVGDPLGTFSLTAQAR